MKRFFALAVLLVALTSVRAQFVDLGLQGWKGDFAVGDIDNDGDLDIIYSGEANESGTEIGGIFINDGSGHFTLQSDSRVITMGRSGNIQFGDIDGDGDLDIIFAGWGCNNTVKAGIALNDGNGIFTLASTSVYPVLQTGKITSAGFADFDMNGLLDYYFFGNGPGNCVIYFQQPDGSFVADNNAIKAFNRFVGTGNPIAYNLNEAEVTVVDFDNDHYPDIFITAADDNASGTQNVRFSYLFKNDGFGRFTQFEGVNIPFMKANGTSSWGDVNGDRLPDLLLNGDANLNSGETNDRMWRIYKNDGGMAVSRAFEEDIARQGSMSNGSLFVDWDGDGDLDFFTNGWNENRKKQEVALYTCEDPANFIFTRSALTDTYFYGVSEAGLHVADLNGDGKVDLLFNGFSGGTGGLNRRAVGYMLNQSPNAQPLPAAPTGLNARIGKSDNDVMVTFSWTAPSSESGKYGTTYNLALKNTTTGKWLYNPMAVVGGANNGWRKIGGRAGNVFGNTGFELYNLPNGVYEWTVQAINGAYLGGAFAETKTFTIENGSGMNDVNYYNPKVYGLNNKLKVEGTTGEIQSLKVYAVNGMVLASTSFTNNTEVELPAGIYIVELAKVDATPFRTKVLVK